MYAYVHMQKITSLNNLFSFNEQLLFFCVQDLLVYMDFYQDSDLYSPIIIYRKLITFTESA